MTRKATRKQFDDLTESQMTVLRILLDGGTVSDAATIAGVSRQTASEWKN